MARSLTLIIVGVLLFTSVYSAMLRVGAGSRGRWVRNPYNPFGLLLWDPTAYNLPALLDAYNDLLAEGCEVPLTGVPLTASVPLVGAIGGLDGADGAPGADGLPGIYPGQRGMDGQPGQDGAPGW